MLFLASTSSSLLGHIMPYDVCYVLQHIGMDINPISISLNIDVFQVCMQMRWHQSSSKVPPVPPRARPLSPPA